MGVGAFPRHCPLTLAERGQPQARRCLAHLPSLGAKKSIPTAEHPLEPATTLLSSSMGFLPSQNIYGPPRCSQLTAPAQLLP